MFDEHSVVRNRYSALQNCRRRSGPTSGTGITTGIASGCAWPSGGTPWPSGRFFRYSAHQADAFTEAVKTALRADLSEVIALTEASRKYNEYERNQHQRLARKLGFATEWILDLCGAEAEPESLDAGQQAVRDLAIAMVDDSPPTRTSLDADAPGHRLPALAGGHKGVADPDRIALRLADQPGRRELTPLSPARS